MWRNLAKVQSTIQTIGNAVAPPFSDDEEDDEEEYEDDEGDGADWTDHPPRGTAALTAAAEEEDVEEEDDDIHSQVEFASERSSAASGLWGDGDRLLSSPRRGVASGGGAGGPLGLVGFLARALDAEQRDYDASHRADAGAEGEEQDDDDFYDEVDFEPLEPQKAPAPTSGQVDDSGTPQNDSADSDAPALESHRTSPHPPPLRNEPARHERVGTIAAAHHPPPGEEDRTTPLRCGPDRITTLVPDVPVDGRENEEEEQEPPPRRFGLVRESGSVSPYNSPQSVRSVSKSSGRHALPGMPEEGDSDGGEQERSPPLTWQPLLSPEPEQRAALAVRASPLLAPSSSSSILTTPNPPNEEPSTVSPRPPPQPSAPVARFQRPPPAASSPRSPNGAMSMATTTGVGQEPRLPPAPLPHPAPTEEKKHANAVDPKTRTVTAKDDTAPSSGPGSSSPAAPPVAVAPPQTENHPSALERRCRELERLLAQSQEECLRLQDEREAALAAAASATAAAALSRNGDDQEALLEEFQRKETRLLAAANEEHERELRAAESEHRVRVESLAQELEHERDVFARERECLEQLVADAQARAERAERHLQRELAQREHNAVQRQKQQQRELQRSADQLAQTMALLDEREEQVTQLKGVVQTLQSRLSEHAEGAQLAEDEVEELHHENEELRQRTQHLEDKCAELRGKVEQLHGDSTKLSELKLELRMLKEERDRERAKNETETAHAHGSRAQIEEERDVAMAQVQDLQQQLAAARADLEIAKADTERVMLARSNLQIALESFQSEREAELALWEEQRHDTERAIAAAHAAALEALRETNDAHIREIQQAADASVRHAMEEIQQLEGQVQTLKVENVQMRRSLDEAIHRLQATQEDVIDRTLMKNILMDWLTKTGSKERRDVLELMASVLHFTDDEKERVHIGSHGGALEKVVHTVAAPLPPTKADLEHLAGDTVREKWINFLLAETDD